MNKKNLMIISIILIIFFALFYYRPLQIGNLLQPSESNSLPWKIETSIFFSALSEKELTVTKDESIKELITFIEGLRVRRSIITPQSYRPQLKETYRLDLYKEDNKNQYLNILNSKYMQIDHRQYKILGKPNLSKIYDIIILDQSEGTLDKFYYDLIEDL